MMTWGMVKWMSPGKHCPYVHHFGSFSEEKDVDSVLINRELWHPAFQLLYMWIRSRQHFYQVELAVMARCGEAWRP